MLRAPKSQHGGKVPTFEKPTKIVTKKEEDMRERERIMVEKNSTSKRAQE